MAHTLLLECFLTRTLFSAGYLSPFQRTILEKVLLPIYLDTIDHINSEIAEVNALSGTFFVPWTSLPVRPDTS